MRDQRDPELVAPLDDAAAQCPVVEGGERDLDRRDRSQLERLVELAAGSTFATPTRRTSPSSASRASARTDVVHGVRGSGAWTR